MKTTIIIALVTIIIALAGAVAITKEEVLKGKSITKKVIFLTSYVLIAVAPTLISILLNIGYLDFTKYKTTLIDVEGISYINENHINSVTPSDLESDIANIRYNISSTLCKKNSTSQIDINSSIASKTYLNSNPTQAKEYYRLIKFIIKFTNKNQSIHAYNLLGDYSLAYVKLLIGENENNEDKIFTYVNLGIDAYLEYMKFDEADISQGYNQIGILYQTLADYLNDCLLDNNYDDDKIKEIQQDRNKFMMLSFSFYKLADENLTSKNSELSNSVTKNLSAIECDIGVAFDDNQVCLDWFKESLDNTLKIHQDIDKVCYLLSSKIDKYNDHAKALGLESSNYYLHLTFRINQDVISGSNKKTNIESEKEMDTNSETTEQIDVKDNK